MSDKLIQVRKGERPSASQQNEIIRRIGNLETPQSFATTTAARTNPGTSDNLIKIKNGTGQVLERGYIVSLADISEPSEREPIFFNAVLPSNDLPFAIVIEHAKEGEIVLAQVYGVYKTMVELDGVSHQYATIEDGNPKNLRTCEGYGPFKILWRQGGTGNGMLSALVQFPAATAEGSPTGFRPHSHASNRSEDGGLAFSVYAPGTSVPQLPWE